MTQYLEDIVRPFTVLESKPVSRIVLDDVTDVTALPPATVTWGQSSQFILPDRQIKDPIVAEWGDVSLEDGWSLSSGGTGQIPIGDFLDRWGKDALQPFEDPFTEEPLGEEEPNEEEERLDDKLVFREIARAVTVVRVTNPEDSAQYVDVERIDKIQFRGPDGKRYELQLNNGLGY